MDNKKIVENFVNDVIIGKKITEATKYLDSKVTLKSCGGVSGKGIAETLEGLQIWAKAFKILENECLCSLSEDNRVIEQWRVKGVHVGEFLNVPPSNKTVVFTGVSIYEIEGGKIVHIFGYSDFLTNHN